MGEEHIKIAVRLRQPAVAGTSKRGAGCSLQHAPSGTTGRTFTAWSCLQVGEEHSSRAGSSVHLAKQI